MTRGDLADALSAWSGALGTENVTASRAATERAGTTTYATDTRVAAVLRPASRSEVERVVQIAVQHRIPLYPVSCGRNWGLGSKVPTTSGAAVVELSRMNRIVDFDEEFGCMTVQPGVTFTQAAEWLRERRSKFAINVTMGPPGGSLIGNALECGHGYGPYHDRIQHTCGMEVVLPTGRVIRTGLSRHPEARAARLHRSGAGPHLQGLFIESNFGIVTEMTFWLERRPKDLTHLRFRIPNGSLDETCVALRELADNPHVVLALHNRERIQFDTDALYPPGKTGRPAPEGCLFGGGSLYAGSALEGFALRRRVLGALSPSVVRMQHLSPLRRAVARPLRRPLGSLFGIYMSDAALDPPIGEPSTTRIHMMYAMKPKGMNAYDSKDLDLDRDRCGVMWCCPTLPLAGEDVRRVLAIADEHLTAQGFPAQVSFMPHHARSFESFCAIVYDRDDADADARAGDAFHTAQKKFERAGYPPYRIPIQQMAHTNENPEYARLLQDLKRTLDPEDIMAPGRYDARACWPPTETSC